MMDHSSNYKQAVLFIAIPLFTLFVVLTFLSMWLQPFRGDLTRISGLPSNIYGWNSPQEVFEKPLFDVFSSPKLAKKSYDIVVLGDSFSENLEYGWINYLAAKTGWSAVRYDIRTVRPETILNSKLYQQSPPKLFIYQTVERRLFERAPKLRTPTENCANITLRQLVTSYPFNPQPLNTKNREIPPAEPFNFNAPMLTVKKLFDGFLPGQKKVYKLRLNRDDLFSSTDGDELLYFYEDHHKFKITSPTVVANSRCGLLTLQQKVERNNKTNFLAVIAPDKSNIYAPYIKQNQKNIPILEHDINSILQPPLNTIDLHHAFRQAVKNGQQDVYLPDDTHWGVFGHELLADKVVEFLQ